MNIRLDYSLGIQMRLTTLTFALLCACSCTYGQSDNSSHSEANAQAVHKFAVEAYSQCLAERRTRIEKTRVNNPSALPIIGALFSESYCACSQEHIEKELSPRLLETGSANLVQIKVLPIIQRCALDSFKTEIPTMCRTWFEGLFGKELEMTESDLQLSCSCMQTAADGLDARELNEVAKQTIQDYQEWRLAPEKRFVAPRPKSFLGPLGVCLKNRGFIK